MTPPGPDQPVSPPTVLRMREVRDRALLDLDDGPVTPSNRVDLLAITRLLNVLLASLVVSSLQYEQHALGVRAPSDRPLAELLFAAADRDRVDARRLAARIRQLGSVGEYDPQHLTARSRVAFRTFPDGDLVGVVTQNLVGARILVQTLQEAVRWVGDDDPTTRRLLERLLEEKETQADELSAQSARRQTAAERPGARPAT
ncbi:ferritin-like domain-containing protein [Micromonospora cathayae]|uniref:Ferritin-like domain-containing protein n=1 Tax=Micromonospora cathayae TaxID=3028804 RepID=A0ABY7ZUA1_9ACTN|nr:ferritin-like domain-containing protein [Micromonospora sp. HUAS 3]WDZ86600.1 ferritin-like domain-containing protein [Micromonospora sp. HUAS 3]